MLQEFLYQTSGFHCRAPRVAFHHLPGFTEGGKAVCVLQGVFRSPPVCSAARISDVASCDTVLCCSSPSNLLFIVLVQFTVFVQCFEFVWFEWYNTTQHSQLWDQVAVAACGNPQVSKAARTPKD